MKIIIKIFVIKNNKNNIIIYILYNNMPRRRLIPEEPEQIHFETIISEGSESVYYVEFQNSRRADKVIIVSKKNIRIHSKVMTVQRNV